MSGVISRWFGGIEALAEISERLLRVQIENRPAIDVIRLYDSPDTLFYCDPPYLHETRGDSKAYGFEMDEEQHRTLAAALHAIRGKAAVSGYRCALMDRCTRAGAGSTLIRSIAIPSSSSARNASGCVIESDHARLSPPLGRGVPCRGGRRPHAR